MARDRLSAQEREELEAVRARLNQQLQLVTGVSPSASSDLSVDERPTLLAKANSESGCQ